MKSLRLIALVLGLLLIAAACGSDETGEYALVAEDTLTVCTDSPYPPMEFEDPDTGEFTGFDIELMRAIADELGLGTAVVNTGFDGITSGLAMESGECDIAAASITITEEREANIDFSDPYFSGDQSLLAATEMGFNSLADVSGKNLGVQTGTTGELYANENASGANIISYEGPGDLITALQAGEVDAVLQDIVVNGEAALNDDALSIIETYPTEEFYGLAVREDGKEALLEAVNEALEKFREDGTYDRIYNDWF